MAQLHKPFTSEQIKEFIQKYLIKEIEQSPDGAPKIRDF